jgi:CubicO group peptidase (beta-lactamase class C family)
MWWLNTDVHSHKAAEVAKNSSAAYARQWERFPGPGAPTSSYAARGGGGHLVWMDSENDIVIVTRWLRDRKELIKMVVDAVRE